MIDDYLTSREKEVIRLICKGYSNKQIMEELNISEGTRNTHFTNLYQKFFVSDGKKEGMSIKRLRIALAYLKEHKELLDEL
ncbi:MAG: response regulator transcription factor [Clostridia bacterium]|nr:response regulator transcription factor [Clostridia bacterium]